MNHSKLLLLLVLVAFAGGFWSAWAVFGRKRIQSRRLGSGPIQKPRKDDVLRIPSPETPVRSPERDPIREPSPSPPDAVPVLPVPKVEPSPILPEPQPTAWPKAPKADGGISADWASFVSDRLAETNPTESSDETKWALGVVDFLDELKESEADASEAERTESRNLSDRLKAALAAKGFELVDSDEWNPDRQRAVAVSREPDATGTKILGKGSTGLSLNGKIIRKQEVKIETKGN